MTDVELVSPVDAASSIPKRSANRSSAWAAVVTTPRGLFGAIVGAVITLTALVVPPILGLDAYAQSATALAAPSGQHWLGTDEIGRDILARILIGIRIDLVICIIAVPVAAVLGATLGLLSGLNRVAGEIIQRVFDVLIGFPGVILGIAVSLAMGPGTVAVIAAIVIGAVPNFGRQTRAATNSELGKEYVIAARSIGSGDGAILRRHVLPNLVDTVTTLAGLAMAGAIRVEGGLSVVGLGVQPPSPSLGSMLSNGSRYIFDSPQYALVPVLLLGLLVLSFIMISDAINRARLR